MPLLGRGPGAASLRGRRGRRPWHAALVHVTWPVHELAAGAAVVAAVAPCAPLPQLHLHNALMEPAVRPRAAVAACLACITTQHNGAAPADNACQDGRALCVLRL